MLYCRNTYDCMSVEIHQNGTYMCDENICQASDKGVLIIISSS